MLQAQVAAEFKLRNRLHSLLLMLGMAGLLGTLAYFIGGPSWTWMALLVAVSLYLFMPQLSPELLLRTYRARPIPYVQAGALYDVLQIISRRAGLPAVPVLYYLPSPVPNAFAVGTPEVSAIALSDGLLRRLNVHELAGVLGHEVAHIHHQDMHIMGFADLMTRLAQLLAWLGWVLIFLSLPALLIGEVSIPLWILLVLVFAPTLSALLQLALSRTREYDADLEAAQLLGEADGLISALQKIEGRPRGLRALLWPYSTPDDSPGWLRTHPPVAERVRRLAAMRWPQQVWERLALRHPQAQLPLSQTPLQRRRVWFWS